MAHTVLSRTPSGAGNRKTYTISLWVKRSQLGSQNILYSVNGGTNNTNYMEMAFNGIDNLNIGGYTSNFLVTTAKFRDTAAWYHIVWRVDTTQSTADDRFRLYVNGVQETAFSTRNNPGQNDDTAANMAASTQVGSTLEGYISQYIMADGQSYAPTVFGSTNANGIWIPNSQPSVTYGTNGFKLDFAGTGASADASGFGADSSGNNNHFASSNLGTNPSTTDTCINNFCTLNPVDNDGVVLSKGNLDFDSSSGSDEGVRGTLGVKAGKWYYECKITGSAGLSAGNIGFGQTIMKLTNNPRGGQCIVVNGSSSTDLYNFSSSAVVLDANNGFGQNDILGVALNLTNNQISIYRNGTQVGSTQNIASGLLTNGEFFLPCMFDDGGSNDVVGSFNFGNPPFTIASGNADANGYGVFEYAVPSGYYALCTKNLGAYGG